LIIIIISLSGLIFENMWPLVGKGCPTSIEWRLAAGYFFRKKYYAHYFLVSLTMNLSIFSHKLPPSRTAFPRKRQNLNSRIIMSAFLFTHNIHNVSFKSYSITCFLFLVFTFYLIFAILLTIVFLATYFLFLLKFINKFYFERQKMKNGMRGKKTRCKK